VRTSPVVASIRETVPARPLATQTAPSAASMPEPGLGPVRTVPWTSPAGSIFQTAPSWEIATQR
jgi:hypothetical protein